MGKPRVGYGYETDALGVRTRALGILRDRGGHHLLRFRRWTIEEIRRPHDRHGEHDD